MSAYVVPQAHIRAIVNWATISRAGKRNLPTRVSVMSAQELGQQLLDANVRSVNYRYNDKSVAEKYVHKVNLTLISPLQVLKALDGLEYQCCEPNDYDGSECDQIINALRRAAIRCLPGYEQAEWTIDEEPGQRRGTVEVVIA